MNSNKDNPRFKMGSDYLTRNRKARGQVFVFGLFLKTSDIAD